jgi:hypothetical protein
MWRIWVFTLTVTAARHTSWTWERHGETIESGAFRHESFEHCLLDAKGHGFDFAQPYHLKTRQAEE